MFIEYIMTVKKTGHLMITRLFGHKYFNVHFCSDGGIDLLKKYTDVMSH